MLTCLHDGIYGAVKDNQLYTICNGALWDTIVEFMKSCVMLELGFIKTAWFPVRHESDLYQYIIYNIRHFANC